MPPICLLNGHSDPEWTQRRDGVYALAEAVYQTNCYDVQEA